MEKYIIENGIKYELKGEQYYPIFSEKETTEHSMYLRSAEWYIFRDDAV